MPVQGSASQKHPNAGQIDIICDAFEDALLEGQTPKIEDYLGAAEDPERSVLIGELVAVEAEYKSRAGGAVDLAEYISRFPQQAQLIQELWRSPVANSSGSAGDAGGKPQNLCLLERAGADDDHAWRRLVQLFAPHVYRWGRQAGRMPDDSKSVTRQVFLAVSVGMQKHRGKLPQKNQPFSQWLRDLFAQELATQQRLSDPVHEDAQTSATGSVTRQQDMSSNVAQRAMEMIHSEFPDITWSAFWETVIEQRLADEIGADLQLTPAEVYEARSAVLRRLRLELKDLLSFPPRKDVPPQKDAVQEPVKELTATMTASACPSRDDLSDYLFGKIDELHAGQVAGHIQQCEPCQRQLQSVEDDDPLLRALRSRSIPNRFQNEHELQDAIQAIVGIRNRNFDGPAVQEQLQRSAGGELQRLGQYTILEKLGQGGMGAVYMALHTRLERTVAIKVLAPDRLRDQQAVARFEREMRAVGRLDHPNIVRASDAGELGGVHFLAMEFVDGWDLSTIARRFAPLEVSAACELVRQAAVGLQHIHQQNLVHRDIKPSNLMLTWQPGHGKGELEPVVKILDLGLAFLSEANSMALTISGQVMGTLEYIAPERGDDAAEVDIRSDIYGLGVTLHKLLTGRVPFADMQFDTPIQRMMVIAQSAAPSVSTLRPELPPKLAEIVDWMIDRDPQNRPGTPAEVATYLRPFSAPQQLDQIRQRLEAREA